MQQRLQKPALNLLILKNCFILSKPHQPGHKTEKKYSKWMYMYVASAQHCLPKYCYHLTPCWLEFCFTIFRDRNSDLSVSRVNTILLCQRRPFLYCMSGHVRHIFSSSICSVWWAITSENMFCKTRNKTKFVVYFLIECRNGQLGIIYLYVNTQ